MSFVDNLTIARSSFVNQGSLGQTACGLSLLFPFRFLNPVSHQWRTAPYRLRPPDPRRSRITASIAKKLLNNISLEKKNSFWNFDSVTTGKCHEWFRLRLSCLALQCCRY